MLKRNLLFAVLLVLSSCGPRLDREDLGQIEYEPPKFDPIDEKYPLPKLGELPEETSEETSKDTPDSSQEDRSS